MGIGGDLFWLDGDLFWLGGDLFWLGGDLFWLGGDGWGSVGNSFGSVGISGDQWGWLGVSGGRWGWEHGLVKPNNYLLTVGDICIDTIINKPGNDINNVDTWFKNNGMLLNESKCQFMII